MLEFSLARSTQSFAVLDEGGEVLAYWGWKDDSLASASCQAWMLSCPAIERNKVFAARQSRVFLSALLDTHARVWVLVDPTYRVAVRWLEWLGFRRERVVGPFEAMAIQRGGRA